MIGSLMERPPPSPQANGPSSSENDLKIKFQYQEEQAALNLKRPVSYSMLQDYFQRRFRRHLNIYYTTSTREIVIQVQNQVDLDNVIDLYERSGSKRRMRFILARKRDADELRPVAAPPHGLYHGIQESTLSETSSIFSSGSASYSSSNRLNRFSSCFSDGDENSPRIKTPNPPMNWREGRCLGRGMFGHVYLCLNVDTNEQLVVKKIYMNNQVRRRNRVFSCLENEISVLSALSHAHIVRYHGCAKTSECICIFMEYMTGGTLKEQINDMGAISEGFVVDFTSQILSGLAYLHSKEIIHRDIKSANILRHANAHVKIGDFGSASYLQAICTEQGVDIHGTPHYTAPEIIQNSRRFEQRSDIYSLGVTIIEMLTTHTPWHTIDPSAVHIKIAFEEPEYELPKGTAPELCKAIKSMLQKEPEQRPTAKQLLDTAPFSYMNANETDIIMETIKNIANRVYDDLSPLAISLSKAATDLVTNEFGQSADREGVQFVSKLIKTNKGLDILSSYRVALFQTTEVNNEIIRMANLCSTRMSAVQQTMNEEHDAVHKFHDFLGQVPKINSQLDDINDQLGELHRHLLQIEISLAALSQGKPGDKDKPSIIDVN
ncbi:Mitogen-activated protein kinase kinase kinase 3 [Aphelenchoides bicaudatus]|nr:Mitogen-activated protein kinase kinase kinase 3 [Aphelenchoides bicaudatus]